MNIESQMINNSNECLPWAIPLMDVDHNVLPLHFAIDPGKEVFINDNNNKSNIDSTLNNLAKTLVLTEQDKIELLKKYFDILTLSHKKENCIEKPIPIIVTSVADDVKTNSVTTSTATTTTSTSLPKTTTTTSTKEKSQTLPSNFGRKNGEFSSLITNGSDCDERNKSRAKHLLQKPFQTFGKMGKKIKRNLGQLARRSTSFRLTRQKSSIENNPINVIEENEHNDESIITANNNNENNQSVMINNRIESIINTDNSIFYCDTNVLAAKLYINKKLSYHDELIKNYLTTARVRFETEREKQRRLKEMEKTSTAVAATTTKPNEKQTASKSSITSTISSASSSSFASSSASSLSDDESIPKLNDGQNDKITLSNYQYNCVNNDCVSKSTAETNFLCQSCFNGQKKALISNGFTKITVDENEMKQQQQSPEKSSELEKIIVSDDNDDDIIRQKLSNQLSTKTTTNNTVVAAKTSNDNFITNV